MEGMNVIKIYCKYICKCHNTSPPIQTLYANLKNKAKIKIYKNDEEEIRDDANYQYSIEDTTTDLEVVKRKQRNTLRTSTYINLITYIK
jgi:hypothetical protein